MSKKERIITITDQTTFWDSIPELRVIRNWFTKNYHMQGGVYIYDRDGDTIPVQVSSTIKWLDKLCINTYNEKKASKIAFEYLKKEYPHYGKFIKLF